jgi:hypothetical protein
VTLKILKALWSTRRIYWSVRRWNMILILYGKMRWYGFGQARCLTENWLWQVPRSRAPENKAGKNEMWSVMLPASRLPLHWDSKLASKFYTEKLSQRARQLKTVKYLTRLIHHWFCNHEFQQYAFCWNCLSRGGCTSEHVFLSTVRSMRYMADID